MKKLSACIALLTLSLVTSPVARGERIKDVSTFNGDTHWKMIGTGLVIGLAGTGDGPGFRASIVGLANSLERMGHSVDAHLLRPRNVAMVTVSARLPRWAREGSSLDVTVASIGDAKSLQGGTLLALPLEGLTDAQLYAIAEGPISVGGFDVRSGANNRVTKNHTTVGLVSGGATVLQSAPLPPLDVDDVGIVLHHADRSTAARVAVAVNTEFPGAARAEDAGFIRLEVPPSFRGDPIPFLAAVESLPIEVDSKARVVINERTGTIVVGAGVSLGEAAVAHGGLTIEIQTDYAVSQPAPFSREGETVVVPEVRTYVDETSAHVVRLPATTTVQDIVDVLNQMGATPRDIIAILQALRAGGSLQAELVVL